MIDWIKKFGRFIIGTVRWLWEAKIVWITLLPFVGAFLFIWQTSAGTWEFRFRLTGLILELLGIGAVVYGLNETLKLHLGKNLLHIILEWFKRFPKFGDNPHIVISSINASLLGLSGSLHATNIPAPNSSIEKRVAYLEEHIKGVLSQVQENKIRSENELKKLSDALNAERNERESGDNQVKQDIKESALEDAYIELMGIFWLFTGAISATASTELAKCFG